MAASGRNTEARDMVARAKRRTSHLFLPPMSNRALPGPRQTLIGLFVALLHDNVDAKKKCRCLFACSWQTVQLCVNIFFSVE